MLYAFSHLFAIAAFIGTGFWRRFPLFSIYLVVSCLLAMTYRPESESWIRDTYLRIEPLALALRFVAACEVLWTITDRYPARLIGGLAMLGIAVGISTWQIEPAGSVYQFVQIRRYCQISTAAFLIFGFVFLWHQNMWRWDNYSAHAVILLCLIVKQGVYSIISLKVRWVSIPQWFAADWPGLMITSLCCLAWMILALATGQRSALLHASDR